MTTLQEEVVQYLLEGYTTSNKTPHSSQFIWTFTENLAYTLLA